MNYANIKWTDVANGNGVRVSLFVSGCRRHCKGCFNQETWDFDYGKLYTEETEQDIIDALGRSYIKGFSLLGGEPFEPEHTQTLLKLLCRIKHTYPYKDIWCWTGYRYQEVKNHPMLKYIDVLVDGAYVEQLRNITLQFRGSENQQIINIRGGVYE